jgi:hypothetical protein
MSSTRFIFWGSDTIQRCPPSPTLFNICLESFLWRIEDEGILVLGNGIVGRSKGRANAVEYTDELILQTEAHENVEILLDAMAEFCKSAKRKVSADKCVPISQFHTGSKSGWTPIRSDFHMQPVTPQWHDQVDVFHLCIPSEVVRERSRSKWWHGLDSIDERTPWAVMGCWNR